MGLFFNKKETKFKVGNFYPAKVVIEALNKGEVDVDFEPIEIGSKGVGTGKYAFKAVEKMKTIPKEENVKAKESHKKWTDSLLVKNINAEESYSENYYNLKQTQTPIYKDDDFER